MNLIERGTLVYVGLQGDFAAIVGSFITLTDSWVGIENAVTYRGGIVGPCIIPLAAAVIIRPASKTEREGYAKAFKEIAE